MKKIIFLLHLSLSSFVYSGFLEGMNDYKNSDYRSAFLEWLPLANAEDGIAQYNIARLYKLGKGVRRDDEVSFEWFKNHLRTV
ncbi:sel1 repeat family protein [Bathymodiolus septemdierum thioautotrophic gill symbiont]|uniref:sel1 repeat family protein n=1 Tax=Bathymodiolus septemdierum thioautotrophic gill symbiont TaxID=113267 RepID=UPI000825558B|nr:sel1 repeat family protein [Bathymodiolus septemdierum thioautotrophic gill symbiont]